MEIIGTNKSVKETKTKKIMFWIGITVAILFVVSVILFVALYYLNKNLFKLKINGERVSEISSDLIMYKGDTIYVSLKDIAPLIGYTYYQGGYKEYSEDTDKCYLQCDNEICTFEENTNTIYKTPAGEVDYQYYTIDKPVVMSNNKLYISSEGLKLACNITFSRNTEINTIYINTLQYYVNYYKKDNVYTQASMSFNNQKALLYGMIVTQSIKNTEKNTSGLTNYYGISDIDGNEIVGKKYTSIEFIESTQEFIVQTTENKVGIVTSNGITKVQPQYDSLKQIDKDLNLYLATSNGKQGVIEKNGRILIYLEYDKIGIDTKAFEGNNIKNPYLLFNNAIPVEQNGKWGMYDKRGNLILPLEYDGIGCELKNNKSGSIAVVPTIRAIVVSKNITIEKNREIPVYGLVNYLGRELVPTGLATIYVTVADGRSKYTMVDYNSKAEYDVIEYMNHYVNLDALNDEDGTNAINNNTTTNTTTNTPNTNEITNEITNTTT